MSVTFCHLAHVTMNIDCTQVYFLKQSRLVCVRGGFPRIYSLKDLEDMFKRAFCIVGLGKEFMRMPLTCLEK